MTIEPLLIFRVSNLKICYFWFLTCIPQGDNDKLGFSVVGGMGSIIGDIPVFITDVNVTSRAHEAGLKVIIVLNLLLKCIK